jgi:hypothetical protein
MNNKILIFLMIGLLGFTSCSDSLDVINENEPDFKKVYSSGDDVKTVTSGLYKTFWNSTMSYYGTAMMMATAADNASCSWGNAGMRDMSWEPRKAWTNTPGYGYGNNVKYTFDRMYAVINTASLVLKAMDNGIAIGKDGVDDNMVRAFSRLNMGIAYGTLALTFDKAFIVDEKTAIENATVEDATDYTKVAAQALMYLDEAIALSSNSFTIPSSWMGTSGGVSSTELKKYASSWAARILANTPRNSTQLAAVDWVAVEAYANAGVTSNFSVIMDGWNDWYQMSGDYLTYPGWGVVDMYVVNKMDPILPAHWDDDAYFPAPGKSTNANADKRIQTDFTYLPSNWLRAARGYYHWSNYRYSRYDDNYSDGTGAMPELMLSENDLYKAEAMVYTNRLTSAASIINAGTRTTRGQLPPVAANIDALKAAIHHERVVEMVITGSGLQFFEMRKRDFLQAGTPLHFPIPAKTLETFGAPQPFYTFGGPEGKDGINGSNGGWR